MNPINSSNIFHCLFSVLFLLMYRMKIKICQKFIFMLISFFYHLQIFQALKINEMIGTSLKPSKNIRTSNEKKITSECHILFCFPYVLSVIFLTYSINIHLRKASVIFLECSNEWMNECLAFSLSLLQAPKITYTLHVIIHISIEKVDQ